MQEATTNLLGLSQSIGQESEAVGTTAAKRPVVVSLLQPTMPHAQNDNIATQSQVALGVTTGGWASNRQRAGRHTYLHQTIQLGLAQAVALLFRLALCLFSGMTLIFLSLSFNCRERDHGHSDTKQQRQSKRAPASTSTNRRSRESQCHPRATRPCPHVHTSATCYVLWRARSSCSSFSLRSAVATQAAGDE